MTNFYIKENDNYFHFAKVYHNASPVFCVHNEINSWQKWKDYLKEKMILDEYGYVRNSSLFINMIESLDFNVIVKLWDTERLT